MAIFSPIMNLSDALVELGRQVGVSMLPLGIPTRLAPGYLQP